MSDLDFLNQFNNKQLAELIPAIQKKMKQNEKAEKDALKKKIAALAAESGYSIDDILGSGKAATKRVVKPKYQNPDDPSQTWSGRGRNPKWVVALIEAGGNIEDCAI